MAIMMGLASHCRISPQSVFARKNYFYPDCPKNYQISMYDRPLCEDGYIELEMKGTTRRIGIERVHLEDDAGKLIHDESGSSLVDFNRCCVPLIEIVSKPDIRAPEEAGSYLTRLRQIVRYLGICDGNMEEGSLRCDVNISLRPEGSRKLGTKTEIKNLNSFKAVAMGIRFEIERQVAVLRGGGVITQVTNLWDENQKRLVMMRTKEYAHDYRYFPEPDLLPLSVDEAWINEVRGSIPELPLERERRFQADYGLSHYDAAVLCAEKGVADYYEAVVRGAGDPKVSSNWVMRDVLEQLKASGITIENFPVPPEELGELLKLVLGGVVSGTAGRNVFKEMVKSGEGAGVVVKRLGLQQISESGELERWIEEVLSENSKEVERYRAGKKQLFGFFVGQVMKKSSGRANPKLTGDMLKKRLED